MFFFRNASVLPMDDCYFGNIMDLVKEKKLVGSTDIYLGLIKAAYDPFKKLMDQVKQKIFILINQIESLEIIFLRSGNRSIIQSLFRISAFLGDLLYIINLDRRPKFENISTYFTLKQTIIALTRDLLI